MLTPVLSNLHLWFNNAFRPTPVVQQRIQTYPCGSTTPSDLPLWFNNAFRPTSVVQQRLHLALCNDIGFYTTERHVL